MFTPLVYICLFSLQVEVLGGESFFGGDTGDDACTDFDNYYLHNRHGHCVSPAARRGGILSQDIWQLTKREKLHTEQKFLRESCRVLCNKKLWYREQDVIRELSLSSFPLWLAEGFNVARLIYAAYCISVLKNVSEEDMKSSVVPKMRWNLSGGNMFHSERRKLLMSFHSAIYLPLFSLFWFSD